jgi:putative FmdB family regulatory protein
MPIYSYRCTSCAAESEAKQKFNDLPLTECNVCGGKLQRIITSVGVIFKGSGFYINDNKSKTLPSTSPAAGKEEAKKPAEEAPKTESKAEDNKPQIKPESKPKPELKPKTEGTKKD